MRVLAACALAALLAGCSPSTRTGYESPTGTAYTLSVVSGDGQSGPAILQPITVNVGGPNVQPVSSQTPIVPLAHPLVVLVTDSHGQPVDGVVVRFSDPQQDVIDLGTEDTGYALKTASFSWPSTHGEASAPEQPYRIGTWRVYAQVDPSSGTSNTVTFTVTGT